MRFYFPLKQQKLMLIKSSYVDCSAYSQSRRLVQQDKGIQMGSYKVHKQQYARELSSIIRLSTVSIFSCFHPSYKLEWLVACFVTTESTESPCRSFLSPSAVSRTLILEKCQIFFFFKQKWCQFYNL